MASSYNEKGSIADSWVVVNDDTIREDSNSSIHDNVSYKWQIANNEQTLKDLFVQFYFQCVLSSDIQELEKQFEILLLESCNKDKYTNNDFSDYIIKLCLHNRDIVSGKGLTLTTHMMLNKIVYYCYEKELLPRNSVLKILEGFVYNKYNKDTKSYEHPYGSWKDIKYFLDYFCKNTSYEYINVNKFSIINEIIQKIYIPQMIEDRKNMSVGKPISLCGKWLPRESGRFKALAKRIAVQYHKEVYRLSENNVKIYQIYRNFISNCNLYLDTTQTHMAGKTWDQINFENVTSKTLFLNKESFLNNKNIDEEHRHICKYNFKQFISNKKKNGNYMTNNNTVMPHLLVRSVLQMSTDCPEDDNISLLNMQWNGLMKTFEDGSFMKNGYCFPCIDVSPSMMTDNAIPLQCAIGLGLACSHLCKHNRAFTFSSDPEWIQYDPMESFVERVHRTRNSGWGSTTNIHKMFQRILDVCLNAEEDKMVSQSEIENTCLIIFSDMQFDSHEIYDEEELFSVIRREYKDAGYDNIPFLIFWNLRTTNTFPRIEKSKNMIQLSGNSTSLLEIFMKTSLEELKKLQNWDLLKQILDNKRYILS